MTDTNETEDSGAEKSTRDIMGEVYDRMQADTPDQNSANGAPETASTPEGEPAVTDPAQNTPPGPVEAPASWTADDKALFQQLPPDLQKRVSEREAQREKAVNQKLEEAAQQRKSIEPLLGATQKWGQYLQSINVAPEVAFDTLAAAEYTLRMGKPEEKLAALQKLASDYGIPFPTATAEQPGQPEQSADPTIAALQQSISELQKTVRTQSEQRELERKEAELAAKQEAARTASAEIESFSSLKDESGNLKYPHFNDVRKAMGELIAFEASQGRVLTLDQAYSKAIRLSDDVQAKIEADRKAKADQEAAERAKKARKAASPKTAVPAESGTQKRDQRTIMSEVYDRMHGA